MNDRFNTLANLLFNKLPADVREASGHLRQNFSDTIGAKFDDWGLATHDELAKAQESLTQCRERIEELERRIKKLEQAR